MCAFSACLPGVKTGEKVTEVVVDFRRSLEVEEDLESEEDSASEEENMAVEEELVVRKIEIPKLNLPEEDSVNINDQHTTEIVSAEVSHIITTSFLVEQEDKVTATGVNIGMQKAEEIEEFIESEEETESEEEEEIVAEEVQIIKRKIEVPVLKLPEEEEEDEDIVVEKVQIIERKIEVPVLKLREEEEEDEDIVVEKVQIIERKIEVPVLKLREEEEEDEDIVVEKVQIIERKIEVPVLNLPEEAEETTEGAASTWESWKVIVTEEVTENVTETGTKHTEVPKKVPAVWRSESEDSESEDSEEDDMNIVTKLITTEVSESEVSEVVNHKESVHISQETTQEGNTQLTETDQIRTDRLHEESEETSWVMKHENTKRFQEIHEEVDSDGRPSFIKERYQEIKITKPEPFVYETTSVTVIPHPHIKTDQFKAEQIKQMVVREEEGEMPTMRTSFDSDEEDEFRIHATQEVAMQKHDVDPTFEMTLRPDMIFTDSNRAENLVGLQVESDKIYKTEESQVIEEVTVQTKVTEVKTIKMELSYRGDVSLEQHTEVTTNTDLTENRKTLDRTESIATHAVAEPHQQTEDSDDVSVSAPSVTSLPEMDRLSGHSRSNVSGVGSGFSGDDTPFYIAISSYEPESDEVMSLHEGEKVEVLDDSQDDWWLVKKAFNNKEGWVPGSFLKERDEYNRKIERQLARAMEEMPVEISKGEHTLSLGGGNNTSSG